MGRLSATLGLFLVASPQDPAEVWTPEIPRVFHEAALASIELPLPDAEFSPVHVSSEYYYAIPVRPIFKSYPVYHPDREPTGYWEWLHQQEPEVVFDPAQLKTKEDWIRAGELVFHEGNEYSTGTEMAFVRDPRAYEVAHIPLTKDGTFPYGRYFIRERGKVELGTDACATCHTRALADGSLLFGGAGNFPLGWTIAYELERAAEKEVEPYVTDESSSDYRHYAAPWLEPDPGTYALGMDLAELAAVARSLPPGVIARKRSSYRTPTRVPDLIGIAQRRYLDASGLVQQRDLADLMRYAALNQGADGLSSFGGFRPETEDGKTLPDPKTLTRYSDEALYALALYLYSLEPPANPNPTGWTSARGRRVFQSERCFKCHPAPLYTNNELMPVLDFEPPADHHERFAVMGRRIDTDPGLTLGTRRGTGYYKVPSLLGVWRRGPFLHDGSLATLEDVFDPGRVEEDYRPTGFRGVGVETNPVYGHEYGLDLTPEERADLIAFLKTL